MYYSTTEKKSKGVKIVEKQEKLKEEDGKDQMLGGRFSEKQGTAV